MGRCRVERGPEGIRVMDLAGLRGGGNLEGAKDAP